MSLGLLDTPVRLTWDLHGPGTSAGAGVVSAIAARINEAGVFFVTLEERPLAHPAIGPLVRQLLAGGCQVQMVCTGAEDELTALDGLSLSPSAVQLDVAAFLENGAIDESRLHQVIMRLRHLGFDPALRLLPLRSNLSVISRLLPLCRTLGAGRFKLPNARIGDTFQSCPAGELPRWQDLESFRALWTATGLSAEDLPSLEIHDRFLWEIMTPDCDQARSEYGGCQAANSLSHVDAAGSVYACAAWPERLGSLRDASLEAIWQSPVRLAVRERIARVPAGCFGCRDYNLCLGGCRGLAEFLNQAENGRDLMCREPRQ